MDEQTQRVVTRALDTAIADVATKHFEELTRRLADLKMAENVYDALYCLEGLQQDIMPEYNIWDSLFYTLWYQPAHVNLAYTLARKVLTDRNSLVSGRDSLEVFDFGCGALAMQFGLALAAADRFKNRQTLPQVAIISCDTSEHMKTIGWRIWHRFVEVVAASPELVTLQQFCRGMKFSRLNDLNGMRWLTALHVAYSENADAVQKDLDQRVEDENPDMILVTTHPNNFQWAYSPNKHKYRKHSVLSMPNDLPPMLRGAFEQTTLVRKKLYYNRIDALSEPLLSAADKNFMQQFLTRYPTAWITPYFKSKCFYHTKR